MCHLTIYMYFISYVLPQLRLSNRTPVTRGPNGPAIAHLGILPQSIKVQWIQWFYRSRCLNNCFQLLTKDRQHTPLDSIGMAIPHCGSLGQVS